MTFRDDPRSDAELVTAAQRGSEAAFEVLYRRHRDAVAAMAYRFTRDRDLALDAMQEAFAYLVRKLAEPGFRLTGRLTTLLYPVVKHAARDARLKAARASGGDEALAAIPAGGGEPEPDDALDAALATLSEEHREVLTLRFVDDLPLEAIAAATGVPLGTVKSRLHHALKKLREDPRTKNLFGH